MYCFIFFVTNAVFQSLLAEENIAIKSDCFIYNVATALEIWLGWLHFLPILIPMDCPVRDNMLVENKL
jgi:hypothetical protein